MRTLDLQIDYWNDIGPSKSFKHPVNLPRLKQWIAPSSRILDLGCGYGRALGLLHSSGYHNLIGVDPARAMITVARQRFPAVSFEVQADPPRLDLPDASVDATLLLAVLTCVPTDEGQRAIVAEITRVLRPGGLLYISDMRLQQDARNRERYARDEKKYGTYGVFDLSDGATVRHHDPRWIETLTAGYEQLALDEIEVETMNGNRATAFQWFGCKRNENSPSRR